MNWVMFWHALCTVGGISIKSDKIDVIKDGKVKKYWTMDQESFFVEGIDEDRREFVVWSDGDVKNLKVEAGENSMKVEVLPGFSNFEDFSQVTFGVFYTCGSKSVEEVELLFVFEDFQGEEHKVKVEYLKVCEKQEGFMWNFVVAGIFSILIVFSALLLENFAGSPGTIQNPGTENGSPSHLASFYLGYAQTAFIIICFFLLNNESSQNTEIQVLLNVLSGISLAFIVKHHVSSVYVNLISVILGAVLIVLSTFYSHFIIQDLQFCFICMFSLKMSKFSSLPLLIILAFVVFIYNLCTLEKELVPGLSDTRFVRSTVQRYPCVFALPASFYSLSMFRICTGLTDLYVPGAFLVKFRSKTVSLEHNYFVLGLYAFVFSTLFESFLRGFVNTSSFFLSGPAVVVTIGCYSWYQKEFTRVFLENNEEKLVISEVVMKSFQ